jgi:hypothetical protein
METETDAGRFQATEPPADPPNNKHWFKREWMLEEVCEA